MTIGEDLDDRKPATIEFNKLWNFVDLEKDSMFKYSSIKTFSAADERAREKTFRFSKPWSISVYFFLSQLIENIIFIS